MSTEPTPDALRFAFAAYRRELELPRAVEDRVLSRIRSQLADDRPANSSPSRASARPRVTTAWMAAAAVFVVAAAAGVSQIVLVHEPAPGGLDAQQHSIVEPSPAKAQPHEPEAAGRELRSSAGVAELATPITAPPKPSHPRDTDDQQGDRVRDRRKIAPPAEAKELARAWALLSAGSADKALVLTKRFADGPSPLAQEWAALRVLASCNAGSLSTRRSLAGAFKQRFPNSPLLPRVENTCLGDSDSHATTTNPR